jgi:hypothetical protein
MNDSPPSGYDLIGDIHGHADALSELLEGMGYQLVDGCYRHPTRQVIFLGDFIDRGPKQVAVLKIVIPMVENKAALAIMGNHEFNALAFHTEHPNQPETWLRPRNDKNLKQHLAFLTEFIGRNEFPTLGDALTFFKSLPLWLELDGLRVVHACWEPLHIALLEPLLEPGNKVTSEFIVAANTEGTVEFDGIETLLKGVEYPLPNNDSFHDKDDTPRTEVRIQWWIKQDSKLGEITLPAGFLEGDAHHYPVSKDDLIGYPNEDKPVFIGHYWMKGHPAKLASNVACLDYSVAKDGKLVAYQWFGEKNINDENFYYLK